MPQYCSHRVMMKISLPWWAMIKFPYADRGFLLYACSSLLDSIFLALLRFLFTPNRFGQVAISWLTLIYLVTGYSWRFCIVLCRFLESNQNPFHCFCGNRFPIFSAKLHTVAMSVQISYSRLGNVPHSYNYGKKLAG